MLFFQRAPTQMESTFYSLSQVLLFLDTQSHQLRLRFQSTLPFGIATSRLLVCKFIVF